MKLILRTVIRKKKSLREVIQLELLRRAILLVKHLPTDHLRMMENLLRKASIPESLPARHPQKARVLQLQLK